MDCVHIFIAPNQAKGSDEPEWYRYLAALRQHDMTEVRMVPGGEGLECQMRKMYSWAKSGYLIVMSDSVDDIMERFVGNDGLPRLRPLANGLLLALCHHGYDLLKAGSYYCWSVGASHNPMYMADSGISRKLGLLDGNLSGMLLSNDFDEYQVEAGMGLIYDVALAANLWASGRRFCRYRSLCAQHTYRTPGGQATLFPNPQKRRHAENAQIRKLSKLRPGLVKFHGKPKGTLRTMQYCFCELGSQPLLMRPKTPVTGGRRFEGFADRAMTPAERQRKRRGGLGSV
jgi:hypothetical protein